MKNRVYQDIINLLRGPGKVYVPIDLGGKTLTPVSVEKKDFIEALQGQFSVTDEVWEIGGEWLDGRLLKKVSPK